MTASTTIDKRHYLGIFLISCATLLLELALTRVLSVALWYHFGFLVISTALLGFGAAGATLAVWRRLREDVPLDNALAALSLAFALVTIASFWLMQRIPFDPFSLLQDRTQLLWMPLYYLVVAAPFFCSGMALALLLTRGAGHVNRLYGFDLIGAGLGCVLLAVVIPFAGGSGTIFAAAALGAVAAVAFSSALPKPLLLGAALVCLVLCIGVPLAERVVPIRITSAKIHPPFPPLLTQWNTFSRVDVYERKIPDAAGKSTSHRRILIDGGTAATGISDLRPDVRAYLRDHPDDRDYLSGIAYVNKHSPRVLIIGSGGGSEVLDALHFGAPKIVAVEINPIITRIVSRDMRDYWGGLFEQPEVELVTEEGRSFVRRSVDTYDAIVSMHTISNAAVASGALSLAENYVLTREAFVDYFRRLAPDGSIFFTRPEPQIPRLLATAREALRELGTPSIGDHIYVYRARPDEFERERFGAGRPAFEAGIVVRKTPFSAADIARIEQILNVGNPGPDGNTRETVYSPLRPDAESLYRQLATADDLRPIYRSQLRQIEPATDDKPFFAHLTRWSAVGAGLREKLTSRGLGLVMLGDRPVAEVTLLVLLAQTVVMAAVAILWPLFRFARAGIAVERSRSTLAYFAALGFGFIAVEIALISRYTLFLGQPVYTLAVVLGGLLVFTGIGAALSSRWAVRAARVLPRILAALLVAIVLTGMSLRPLFEAALALSLPLRILVAIASLAPLGVLLGMPFPLGLKLVGETSGALAAWAWGINGFLTVIGTVSTVMIGMTFGFAAAFVAGAACYVLAGAIAPCLNSQESLNATP